ncbi:MAG: hypothetical protein DIJKHBIC_02622 [Thermoanaerobaculia bacterium]|nr:hypothetical protein [Thermoanaerobaculia bacterium]
MLILALLPGSRTAGLPVPRPPRDCGIPGAPPHSEKRRRLPGLVSLVLAAAVAAEPVPARQTGKVLGQGQSPPTVTLTAPTGGWTVDRMVLIAGTFSDATIDPITVSINGVRYLVRTNGGALVARGRLSSRPPLGRAHSYRVPNQVRTPTARNTSQE